MGLWQDRSVYFRDFAFNARRVRMANGNIGDVPASSFAEYVPASFELQSDVDDGASGASSVIEDAASDAVMAATPSGSSHCASHATRPCPALRPSLAHRLYSHQLHVRAKAKLQHDRLLSGSMIDIYVGAPKRHWALHRNLLCHHSELLESELYGDGKNRPERLDLPEHDPAGFELLVKWLYQGKLDDVSKISGPDQKYDYAVGCHKLYLLCERFDMPQLKNVAIDQYRKGLNEAGLVPDADEINDIYRQSPVASPFRRLMTKIAARQIMDPESHRDAETYRKCFADNPDFAIDLVNAIKLGTGGMLFEDPTDGGNECDYHDHEAGPNCHIKGKGKVKQGLSPPPRPEIRQIHSIRKLGPTSPLSPPSSPHSESPAYIPASSPTRRSRRRPSPPSPDESGAIDSRDVDGNPGGGTSQLEGTETEVPRSYTPTATPVKSGAGGDVTPSPRRPPPKLRRKVS